MNTIVCIGSSGNTTQERLIRKPLDKKGWEPFQYNILKQDIPIFMNSDEDLCKRKEVITYIKSIVEYLEEVVKEITFRHTKIKNAIEWRRFCRA